MLMDFFPKTTSNVYQKQTFKVSNCCCKNLLTKEEHNYLFYTSQVVNKTCFVERIGYEALNIFVPCRVPGQIDLKMN